MPSIAPNLMRWGDLARCANKRQCSREMPPLRSTIGLPGDDMHQRGQIISLLEQALGLADELAHADTGFLSSGRSMWPGRGSSG
jgi:hypothetical protein